MNVRRLVAAALTAGVVLVPVSSASATCYVGNVDICDKPTDPYTQPVTQPVVRIVVDTALGVVNGPGAPVVDAVMTVYDPVLGVYTLVVCTALC